ncbi:hypothetical protein GCM10023317_60410 [Actinopolymorpha pittospori]
MSKLVRPARVCIPSLLGDALVDIWPRDRYTADRIGGPQAAAIIGTIERVELST